MELLPPNTHLKIHKYLYYQTYGGCHKFIVRLLCPISKKRYIKNFSFNNYDTNEEAYEDAIQHLEYITNKRNNKIPLHTI